MKVAHLTLKRHKVWLRPLLAPDSCELRDRRPGSVKSPRAKPVAEGALDGFWPPRIMTEREPIPDPRNCPLIV